MKSCHLCKEEYEEVKRNLSMRQVAEFYGYYVQKNGTCLCPFHQDRHPSMKIYPDDKGFYCWVCQKGGDVIKFVAEVFGPGNEEACKRLIEDFSLPISLTGLSYQEKREREKERRKRKEVQNFQKEAEKILRTYWLLLTEAMHHFADPHFEEAFQELSLVEYRMDCLRNFPEDYFADREAVRKLGEIERRIDRWHQQPYA